MAGVVSTLTVNADRMLGSLMAGFSQATDLAEFVMQACDVDYRTAYQVVGRAVRRAAAEGLRGVDVTGAMLDRAAQEVHGSPLGLEGRDLSEVLDPRSIVMTRTSAGGAAPTVVRQMAASVAEEASELVEEASVQRRALGEAEARLVSSAERLAST
jgi:argininosuccinate lyase